MNSIERKDKKRLLFYICGVFLPVLQFVIFYVIINFDSMLMAFQLYDGNNFVFSMPGNDGSTRIGLVENFNKVFNLFSEANLGTMFWNSFKYYIVSILFATGFNILFSNYIYKKNVGHKFFQIMLFLPKILSVSVLCAVFKYTMNDGVPAFVKLFGAEITSPYALAASKFNYIMVFTIWSGFGTGVLMYTSTMSGIPTEVVESAQLDGITPFKELVHITMPMIYPTFVTFMIANFAAIFTNEMSLYLFYGYFGNDAMANDMTIGYYLFKAARISQNQGYFDQYTYLSMFGLLLSAIAIPATFGFKWLLEKYGPSFE